MFEINKGPKNKIWLSFLNPIACTYSVYVKLTSVKQEYVNTVLFWGKYCFFKIQSIFLTSNFKKLNTQKHFE